MPRPKPWTLWKVCVPTDLGERSELAYAHALKMAMSMAGRLTVVHAHDVAGIEWQRLPSVRDMLVRWGELSPAAGVDDYDALGLKVRFDEVVAADWIAAVSSEIQASHPEILVLATEGRSGTERVLNSSVAEELARRTLCTALFLGPEAKPIVEPDTGAVHLHRILIPMDGESSQQLAIDWAAGVAEALWEGPVEFLILHAGQPSELPPLTLPNRAGWVFRSEFVKGPVVGSIVETAKVQDVDLVVMTTHGHDSVLDWVMGSRTERVVRQAPCPVLAIPV